MLRSIDNLEDAFKEATKESKEKCGEELEKIRQLSLVNRYFFKAMEEFHEKELPKYANSLVFLRFLELFRTSGHILFISCCGMYRNAFDNIRYALESVVQAFYLDVRHPNIDLKTKLVILREIEDKREYHVVRLIDELEIDHKGKLRIEYKTLSQKIHPSHEQLIATLREISVAQEKLPILIDCEEISKIYDSMKKMYDIFFFLFVNCFPEVKESLRKNANFIKDINVYGLTLLSSVFRVRLK